MYDVVHFSDIGHSEISGSLTDLVPNIFRLHEVYAGNLFFPDLEGKVVEEGIRKRHNL